MAEEADIAEKTEKDNLPALADSTTGEVLDVDQMTQSLEGMEPGLEITTEGYLEFEVDKEYRVFAVGTAQMTAIGNNEKIEAVRFLCEDGSFKINADVVIRTTLLEIAKKGEPYPVLIKCTGTTPGQKGGSYKNFRIYPLG